MRAPTEDETRAYFQTVGLSLEAVPDGQRHGYGKWQLIIPTGGSWGHADEHNVNLMAVWAFWLDHVAYCLTEAEITQTFARAYRQATLEQRREMRGWISDYMNENTPQTMKDLFSSALHFTADTLPLDWKARYQRLLGDRSAFVYQFDREIFPYLDGTDQKRAGEGDPCRP